MQKQKNQKTKHKNQWIEGLTNWRKTILPKTATICPPQTNLKNNYSKYLADIAHLRGRALFYPYLGSGRGQGVYVQLMDGSIKMDLISGIGVHLLGHAHPEIIKTTLDASLSDIVMQGHLQVNKEYLLLSKKLVTLASKKSKLKHVWFSPSGSMANENALKIIRQKHYLKSSKHRKKIITFDKAFAGRTIMMSEICGNPSVREGQPSYNEVLRIPFYDKNQPNKSLSVLKSFLKKHGSDISTFVFEIVLGEGGYKSAPRSFFIPLLKECKKHNITIWVDEVQTFCRTGTVFAFEKWGLGPFIDLCTIGKSLQLSAVLFTSEYNPRPGLVSGTFSASTVSLAVGLKILKLMEKKYMAHIPKIEQHITNIFKVLLSKNLIADFDVFGLMASFTLKDASKKNTTAFLKKLFLNGVIAFSCGGKQGESRVRFLIPAVITTKDLNLLKKVLIDIL